MWVYVYVRVWACVRVYIYLYIFREECLELNNKVKYFVIYLISKEYFF